MTVVMLPVAAVNASRTLVLRRLLVFAEDINQRMRVCD